MNAICPRLFTEVSDLEWGEQTNKLSKAVHTVRILLYLFYFHVDLSSVTVLSLCQHLDLLLCEICGIVSKHTEVTVLEAFAHLASTLCSDCYTFSSRAHLAFSQLLDGLTECFNTYLSDILQVGERVSEACIQANMACYGVHDKILFVHPICNNEGTLDSKNISLVKCKFNNINCSLQKGMIY